MKDKNEQTYIVIPTKFINNSTDTLKYKSMSCSWWEFYLVDNDNLKIDQISCDKNIPLILTLAPKQSRTVEIKLLIKNRTPEKKSEFKIGFKLEGHFKDKTDQRNIIWSNKISI